MESSQNSALKHFYQKCKYKLKLWEEEFRKTNGRNPLKDDIRAATPQVKELYKRYYKAKHKLQKDYNLSQCGFEEQENSNVFSNSMEEIQSNAKSDSKPSTTVNVLSNSSNKSPRKVLGVIQSNTCHENNKDSTLVFANAKPVLKQKLNVSEQENFDLHNSSKSDVSTDASSVPKKSNPIKRSSSFHFSEKLFLGSKFSIKRNPRKSFSFSQKPKSSLSSLSSEASDNSVFMSDSTCESSLLQSSACTETEEDKDSKVTDAESSTDLISSFSEDKIKPKVTLITHTTSHQAVSIVHSALTKNRISNLAPVRKLDPGWLERCTQVNSLDRRTRKDSCDDHSDNDVATQDCQAQNSTLMNARDENQTMDSTPTCKPDSESYVPNENSDSEEIISDSDTENNSSLTSRILPMKRKRDCSPSFSMVNKRMTQLGDTEEYVPTESVPMDCGNSKSGRGLGKKGQSGGLSKKEILERKVESGKANENYVRINIKKKIYVRGRKNTSYSKYKKMMWKKRQNSSVDDDTKSGRLLKCFKCGDIGHFARNCLKVENQQCAEEEEEVYFPTLEEAALMADQASEEAHRRKRQRENAVAEVQVPKESNTCEEVEQSKEEAPQMRSRGSRIEPYYQLNEHGSVIGTPDEVYDILKMFGHETFRPGQEEAVMRVLSGLPTLLILSTGAGKSLCYQLPAYMYAQRTSCITLVVSPLVSLMEDQVTGLPPFLHAACLHTNQSPKQREKVVDLVKKGDIHVLLVSPEAVVGSENSTGFGSLLRELPPIAFACIDEAHCVSQWSHNFRPSYLRLCKILRDRLGVTSILGLTATATKYTARSIVEHIGISEGDENAIIKGVIMPRNLCLSVSCDEGKDSALISMLRGERFSSCESIIIYCTRREECVRLAAIIRTRLQDVNKRESNIKNGRCRLSWNAEPYHAGLSAARRKQVQDFFMAGKLRIVVATVAFGMGINKQNIRGIIHYNMPKNFESYVQEIGRAGRDGLPAHCHVFLDAKGGDLNELKRHIYANSMDRHTIRKLLQKVFIPCKCNKLAEMLGDSMEVNQDAPEMPQAVRNEVTENQSVGEDTSLSQEVSGGLDFDNKVCPGHEVGFPIYDTVMALDLPEENISTLLCYLELHSKKWIHVLSSVYLMCKIQCYGGSKQLKAAAKKCPPLAVAIALNMKKGSTHDDSTKLEFPVVEVASSIGWDSGIVKKHLKGLEWTKIGEKSRKSGIVVEFSIPGFHVRSPGNLSPTELDEALETLHQRAVFQEKSSLMQLETVFKALSSISYRDCVECCDAADDKRSDSLKDQIRAYFEEDKVLKVDLQQKVEISNPEQLQADIRSLVCSFRDNNFTARSIARILHGIGSPCYPPHVWGRNRFWRLHLETDFNYILQIAAQELLSLR